MKVLVILTIFNCVIFAETKLPNTIDVFKTYLDSKDWKLRVQIRQAHGSQEILQSRIYQAFDIVRKKSAPFGITKIKDNAWHELYRNPILTVDTLYPMLFEKLTPNEIEKSQQETYPEVSQESKDIIFNIFYNIAIKETKPHASSILEKLTKVNDKYLTESAVSCLETVMEDHWSNHLKKYKNTKDFSHLYWLEKNMLKILQSEKEVSQFLGTPDKINNNYWIYEPVGYEEILKIKLFDEKLIKWEWVKKKP